MQPTELCQLATDWKGLLPTSGAMVERKMDGFRALYIRDWQGKPGLFTRNGHPIEGVGHILWHLGQMEEAHGGPLFVDGEFVVDGTLAATKAWCERGYRQGGEAGHFHVFDCLPWAEWKAGGGATPLYKRKTMLADLVKAAAGDGWTWRPGSRGRDDGATPISLIPDEWAFDAADVLDLARRVWAIEGEGVMVKDPEAPYERRRNGHWLKVKKCNAHKWNSRTLSAASAIGKDRK